MSLFSSWNYHLAGQECRYHIDYDLDRWWLEQQGPGQTPKEGALVLTHPHLAKMWQEKFAHWFPKAQFLYAPVGEGAKSFEVMQQVLQDLLEAGATRKAHLYAVGGGVIGDLGGFVASSYMRGIELTILPTTVLAMVDAAIGGKTAINFLATKNIVGSFYPANQVICDLAWLETLPERYWVEGFAEVLKHAVLEGGDFWQEIASGSCRPCDLKEQKKKVLDLIARAAKFKCQVVENDFKESGQRALLNLGHTLGHALEACAPLDSLAHGEAVAVGMNFAFFLSQELRLLEREADYSKFKKVLELWGLPLGLDRYPTWDEVAKKLSKDKKHGDSSWRFVLPQAIGNCTLIEVSKEQVGKAYERFLHER